MSATIARSHHVSSRYEVALLNQCLHLGEVELMTRMPGISILSRTEFGAFYFDGSGEWLVDLRSGLRMRAGRLVKCHLLEDRSTGEVRFDVRTESDAEITVFSKQTSSVTRKIVSVFGASRDDSPAPWMDEWTVCDGICAGCPARCQDKFDQIMTWSEITLSVQSRDLRYEHTIFPSWVDREDTVLRLSDRCQSCSLYVDLASSRLEIRETAEGRGSLTHRMG